MVGERKDASTFQEVSNVRAANCKHADHSDRGDQ